MIPYYTGSDFAPSDVLPFRRGCAKRSNATWSGRTWLGNQLWQTLQVALAGIVRRDIENKMVAIRRLQSDPKAVATALAKSIVSIAATRDEASFEIVFRHFAPRLKSYFLRRGADSSLAEEITQDALVLVWRNAALYNPSKASASTWVFTIARNLSVDRFRRTRRPAFDPTDPAFVPDVEASPDQQLERAEADQRVREVMSALSANEKSVLMLSFYENHSHGEIARQLNLPVGTVKSRIRLAFAKIRAALDVDKGNVG